MTIIYHPLSVVQADHHAFLCLPLPTLAALQPLLPAPLTHPLDVQAGQRTSWTGLGGRTGFELAVAVDLHLLGGFGTCLALGDYGEDDAVHTQTVGGFLAEGTHPTRVGGVGDDDEVVLEVEALEVRAEESPHGDLDALGREGTD